MPLQSHLSETMISLSQWHLRLLNHKWTVLAPHWASSLQQDFSQNEHYKYLSLSWIDINCFTSLGIWIHIDTMLQTHELKIWNASVIGIIWEINPTAILTPTQVRIKTPILFPLNNQPWCDNYLAVHWLNHARNSFRRRKQRVSFIDKNNGASALEEEGITVGAAASETAVN